MFSLAHRRIVERNSPFFEENKPSSVQPLILSIDFILWIQIRHAKHFLLKGQLIVIFTFRLTPANSQGIMKLSKRRHNMRYRNPISIFFHIRRNLKATMAHSTFRIIRVDIQAFTGSSCSDRPSLLSSLLNIAIVVPQKPYKRNPPSMGIGWPRSTGAEHGSRCRTPRYWAPRCRPGYTWLPGAGHSPNREKLLRERSC